MKPSSAPNGAVLLSVAWYSVTETRLELVENSEPPCVCASTETEEEEGRQRFAHSLCLWDDLTWSLVAVAPCDGLSSFVEVLSWPNRKRLMKVLCQLVRPLPARAGPDHEE